jgi:SAM-dependent methyltransferase
MDPCSKPGSCFRPDPQYAKQERGAGADYERYLAGMDASMQQKVALTAAHVLGQGWVADMGMGSGTGSEALAALYPSMRVTGVDINPEMVERAAERYQRPNLDFQAGDIGKPCFELQSLDAIFNSSVLHHVTSFNDYRIEEAALALEHQVAQLRPHGSLIVRDFVRPADGQVMIDLPEPAATLFRRFAREFRFLKPPAERGFDYQEQQSPLQGWSRFCCQQLHAVEFVLRKDYQSDWDTEVLEEYTYFTQREFEAHFHRLGLRILASTPLWNPWIISNRFEGQFQLYDSAGTPLGFPPTNYLIVGEKVPSDQGVFYVPKDLMEPEGFLEFTCYQHRDLSFVRELVRRPNLTVDTLPYFEQDGELYVLARKSYPRPLMSLCADRLDGALSPTYVTEPISIICGDKPLAQTVEEALNNWAGVPSDDILEFAEGSTTYPSPGGVQEEIRSFFVKIKPMMVGTPSARDQVRAIEAGQLLRAAQVGGLPDARLETHCFELMRRLGRPPGPWIGETISLCQQSDPPETTSLEALMARPRRRAYQRSSAKVNFLGLRKRRFEEHDAQGRLVSEVSLEFVEPAQTSLNTVAVAPLWKHGQTVYFGVMDEDLPAAQCFSGHSNHLQAPAWRLPQSVRGLHELDSFLRAALLRENGLATRDSFQLGGPYFPSPGVTPEIAYPWAIDVAQCAQAPYQLSWIPLQQLVEGFAHLKEGHLRTLVSRIFRALG